MIATWSQEDQQRYLKALDAVIAANEEEVQLAAKKKELANTKLQIVAAIIRKGNSSSKSENADMEVPPKSR